MDNGAAGAKAWTVAAAEKRQSVVAAMAALVLRLRLPLRQSLRLVLLLVWLLVFMIVLLMIGEWTMIMISN